MVIPKYRFVLLKILNKIMFGKYCAGNILAVELIRNGPISIKKNFFFYMKIFDEYYSQNIASTLFSKHNLIQNL